MLPGLKSGLPSGLDGPEGPQSDKVAPNEDDWNRRWDRTAEPPAIVSRPSSVRRLNRDRPGDKSRQDRGAFKE